MAQQRKTYPLYKVRQDYSYTVAEIANLFDIYEYTVLRWLKEGLPHIPQTRPYLIYGQDLKGFLSERQNKRKQLCKENQIYCFKCRVPQEPILNSLTSQITPHKMLHISGKCSVCHTKVNKLVNPKKLDENHPFYHYIQTDKKQHSVARQSQPKCSVQKKEQLCLNLTQ